MKVTYLEKGMPHDFKRIDTERTVNILNYWYSGNLLYGYRDRFNIVCIAREDILKIEE